MKTFASPSFFRTFDLLLAKTNPGLKRSDWIHDGVGWERERHSFGGRTHGFAVEVTTMTRSGRQGWTLMVVKEFWWMGNQGKELRSSRWAQLLSGRRNDALGWMREQASALERALESDAKAPSVAASAGAIPRR
jgi:hypothetical protein